VKLTYPAVYEYAADGINIAFPDVPGAFTCAFSRRQAKIMAKEVLMLMLHKTSAADLPKPSDTVDLSGYAKAEMVPITVRMREKGGVLLAKGVKEYPNN
jgi:predicted RNase H-like HicB family nuclease